MSTTRSHKEIDGEHTAARHREFMHAILADLSALERMLAEGMFETGVRRIGAEQEMFLIDKTWAPADGVLPMLEKLADEHYTTELDGGHLGSVSGGKIRAAKAFWIVMARLAGWTPP